MHGLHTLFYFERKKNVYVVFLLYLFMGICLCEFSFFFLAYFLSAFWKDVSQFFVIKTSILDGAVEWS